ncbi:fibrillin-1-like [Sycon ciliatum]|uniref:fibrillin-1-like n=1 Tax=Sycon ciliatum TaxID=27933 RepID=UPI0031F64ACF
MFEIDLSYFHFLCGNRSTCKECQFSGIHVASIEKASGKVTCVAGFTHVEGTAAARCPGNSSTGQWVNVGRCKALCSAASIIDGRVDGTRVMVTGSTAQLYSRAVYNCNSGFRLSSGVSNTSIQCSVVGGIADFHSAPTCVACKINGSGQKISSVSDNGTVTCDNGYYYSGTRPICEDLSPNWQNLVSCQACGVPPGQFIDSISSSGVVTCVKGYEVAQVSSAETCTNAGGEWKNAPTCTIKTCQISAPGNGSTNPISVSIKFNETVVYSCDIGFRLVGEDKGLCDASDTLDVVPPKCQDIDECSTGVNICHAMASCSNIIGSFECSCKSGYYGNGTSCEECQFSEVNVAGIEKASGMVTCVAGFTRVEGTATAICPKNYSTGYWLNVGSCQALCSAASIIDGRVDGTRVMVTGSIAQLYSRAVYICNSGFRLSSGVSNTSIQCSVVGGVADFHSAPTCDACKTDGSGRKISSVSYNGTVTCDNGYYYNGTQPVCEDLSPNWQNLASCQACKAPPGRFIQSISSNGAVTCVDGYEVVQDNTAETCTNTDGVWRNAPTCTIKTCLIKAPGNGSTSPVSSSIQFNEQVVYSCDNGFRLVGEDKALCDSSGTLNAVPPKCQDIDECTAGVDDCDAMASCTNIIGSFECSCKSGYYGNGTSCEDIDECTAGVDDCDAMASCSNTIGSFECSCKSGYYGNGTSCEECQFSEMNVAVIEKAAGKVTCVAGYTRVEGTAAASCPRNSSTGHWMNVGSCQALCSVARIIDGRVYGTRVMVAGSIAQLYSRAVYNCNSGFRLSSGVSNTSIQCSVVGGIADFHSAPTCDDIDECTTGVDDCDAMASCSNTIGSFECSCKSGYYGNGTSCEECKFIDMNVAVIEKASGKVTCVAGYTRVEGTTVASCPRNSSTGHWMNVGSCQGNLQFF